MQTPGPWTIALSDRIPGWYRIVNGHGASDVADCICEDRNARLIAAAPALAAALERAATALDNLLPDEYRRPATAHPTRTVTKAEAEAITALDDARAALAAARGEG